MSTQPSILVVDDEEIMREVITTLLEEVGYRVISSATGEEGIEKVKEEAFDLVLLDLMLPSMSGLETLEEITRIDPDIVVVMISAYASIESAVDATKSGAFDFITKPFKNEKLLLVVKNGLKKRSLEIENRQLKRTLNERISFQNIVGKSEPMQQVFDLITQVAPRRSTVLIAGESGTGKELVARAIHSCSPRSNHAFVAVNSGSIPNDLLESELSVMSKEPLPGPSPVRKACLKSLRGEPFFLMKWELCPLKLNPGYCA